MKTLKKGKTKRDLAEQLREDIRNFKKDNNCDRLVMVWCGSTEIFLVPGEQHETLEAFEKPLGSEAARIRKNPEPIQKQALTLVRPPIKLQINE